MNGLNAPTTVSETMTRWYGKISAPIKTAFWSSILFGLVVHVTAITGWLFNWDTALRESYGWLIAQGKWLSDFVYSMDAGKYVIPFNKLTALFALGITAAFLTDLFNIQSKWWAGLLGACLVSYPSVMVAFSYGVGFWAVVLAVLSVWIAHKSRSLLATVCSVVVLALALGIYQPHIGFTASGMILLCILYTMKEKNAAKAGFFVALRYLGILLAGVALYYVILKIMLSSKGVALSDYQNMSSVENITLDGILRGIKYAYSGFILQFLFDSSGTQYRPLILCYRAMDVLTGIGALFLFFSRKIYKDKLKSILVILFMVLFPPATHAVAILSQGAFSHWIMMYSFVMWPIAFIVVAHKCEEQIKTTTVLDDVKIKPKKIVPCLQQWGCCICCVLMLYFWCVIAHEGYLRLEVAYEGAYQFATDLVDDIYESESYQNGCRTIALVRASTDHTTDILSQYGAYTGIADKYFLYAYDGIVSRFLSEVLTIQFSYASGEEMQLILATPALDQMPCYPEKGYIQEINGLLVVKI